MLKTVVLHNIFVETDTFYFSEFFDEQKKFKRTAFIRNRNHLIDFKCLTDPKRLNSGARLNMCLIILIRYALKELCISTMQHS